jgi:hypothetical protein
MHSVGARLYSTKDCISMARESFQHKYCYFCRKQKKYFIMDAVHGGGEARTAEI